MSTVRNCKGFTLIEVVVVAGIIAILAGFLVPMIFNQVDEAKITRAQGDMKTIQTSIMAFKKDTGNWPIKTTDPAVTVSLLYSDSKSTLTPPIPTTLSTNWDPTTAERLAAHLNSNNDNLYGTTWKGPYMNSIAADPWGNAYIINSNNFNNPLDPIAKVWIISAGPDGEVQSNPNIDSCSDLNASPPGNDVCLRIK